MDARSISLVRASPDSLRYGFKKAAEDIRPVHPVQRLLAHNHNSDWELKMSTVEQVYGKAAAMRLRTEKAIFEQYQRLPGLVSSHVGLDTMTGSDELIEFEDILKGPVQQSSEPFRVHEAMELSYTIRYWADKSALEILHRHLAS